MPKEDLQLDNNKKIREEHMHCIQIEIQWRPQKWLPFYFMIRLTRIHEFSSLIRFTMHLYAVALQFPFQRQRNEINTICIRKFSVTE